MLRHVHLEILCRGLFFVTYFERFLVHICNGASGLVQQQSKMDSFSFCHCKIKLTNEFSSWVAHEIWSQRPTYNKTCFCETRKLIWYRLFLLTFFFHVSTFTSLHQTEEIFEFGRCLLWTISRKLKELINTWLRLRTQFSDDELTITPLFKRRELSLLVWTSPCTFSLLTWKWWSIWLTRKRRKASRKRVDVWVVASTSDSATVLCCILLVPDAGAKSVHQSS